MTMYEYKVIPAPAKGKKAKGIKTPEARFSLALQHVMNDLAQDGWEFIRAETLPSEERSGLTSTTTLYRNVMVFRRPSQGDVTAFDPKVLEKPLVEAIAPPLAEPRPDHAPQPDAKPETASPPLHDPELTEDEPENDKLPLALRARARLAEKNDDDMAAE